MTISPISVLLFLFLSLSLFLCHVSAFAIDGPVPPSNPLYYRELIKKVRDQATFFADIPIEGGFIVSYQGIQGRPLLEQPSISDFYLHPTSDHFYRIFIDRILYQDGSLLKVGSMELPLTCIFIYGQDNRFSGKTSPLIPDFIFKFYLVANDFSCTGPINPAWPINTVRKENWDTYLYFEVRDPTIMLPVEAKIRYRWNEFAVFKKEE
ncbi:MAG: hypothetical protein HQK50_08845 [Oligoflexia bacterium]|nr:hypothetical protein [Oligoflexia bacterium]MBF0365666.1 hypothetical protein [Oligoflexia bacterium]